MTQSDLQPTERYRLIRRIGTGAFGTVYLAHDTFLDEECAVKMPIREYSDLQAFLQEPRLLNRVKSPAIVALRDIESIQGVLCLIMEYVPGGSLRDRMGRIGNSRPLPIPFSVRVARDVLSALRVAHSVGVLHRDIKPDNVLITEEGRAKVTDFGIARIVEAAGGIDFTMQPGGTMVYMSPEALRGEMSPMTDLWATAAMLYEMVTGRLAFAGASTADIVEKILHSEAPPARTHMPGLDPAVDELLATALRRNREERFGTINDLDGALARIEVIEEKAADPGAATTPDIGPERRAEIDRSGRQLESERRTAELLQSARRWAGEGQFPEVVERLRRLLADRPGDPEPHRILGEIYHDHGDDSWAFDEYERAFLLDRTDRQAAEGLAELGLRLRRPGRTIEALVALVEIEPERASYHRRLGLALAQEGSRDRAIVAMERSLEIEPDQPRMQRILERWRRLTREG